MFTPSSLLLRGKSINKPLDIISTFITPAIFLAVPCLFIQKKMPFWGYFDKIIFYGESLPQYHNGFVYILALLFMWGLTGILFFYYIVSIKVYNKYHKRPAYQLNPTFIKILNNLLFSGIEDNSDIWDNWGPPDRNLPYYLVTFVDDFYDVEDYAVPDGYFYYYTRKGIFELWHGSYSRDVLIYWYFSMFFYLYFQVKLYIIFSLPVFFCSNFFLFYYMLFYYIVFTYCELNTNVILKKKHKILLYLFYVQTVTILIIFRLDFMYFFGLYT